MTSLRKISILAIVVVFAAGLAACSKKNEQLETDYATKKASAQTLIDQINQSMTQMKADHDQWMTALMTAWSKPGADTAKINSAKADLQKHESDMAGISALVDSTKLYMNAAPGNDDSLKASDDRLGTNFNDLNDKWKSFQDTHASLQQRIQQLTVATAGNAAAAQDTMKAAPAKMEKKAEPKKAAAPAPPVPPAQQHHGAVRKSAQ
ncbi:MAG TPA: hypothetical protein VGM92_08160 [Candidatus Kapabacteria bacterium]|jgi:predicted  nucleic acid-binding Zn-ribbon protein